MPRGISGKTFGYISGAAFPLFLMLSPGVLLLAPFPGIALFLPDLHSQLCAPVLDRGRTIGVLSLDDVAGSYRQEDLDLLAVIVQTLREPIHALRPGTVSNQP